MHMRLGVNIDHVATLRNARGGTHPDVQRAAQLAHQAGADGLTIHLREDRRHIRDADLAALRAQNLLPINLEMAATDEMQAIALQTRPNACCLVPEKREELTTEGGLDVAGQTERLRAFMAPLKQAGIRLSLFIDANRQQIEAAAACGADIVELHTGAYCDAEGDAQAALLASIHQGATLAHSLGLEVHGGHGLRYDNVAPIAAIPEIVELNIGHFLIGEAVFVGLEQAIHTMRERINEARG